MSSMVLVRLNTDSRPRAQRLKEDWAKFKAANPYVPQAQRPKAQQIKMKQRKGPVYGRNGQKNVLKKLHRRVDNLPKHQRVDVLKAFAESFLGRASEHWRSRMRRHFNVSKHHLLKLKGATCFCCPERAEVRHHLIPIYAGGRNSQQNLVALCNGCHAKVHPWLGSA